MTNPNNAIGTNGAYGGRTSVNAFNDVLQAFTGRGILTGFAISPGTGMQVSIGGDGEIRDVAIAEDNVGNFTTINNITQAPISLDIAAAPSANSRVDAIVAYVTNPPQGSSTVVDNPSACGLIDVAGAVAASPSTPTESDIRSAISADGGSGSTAYFVVLGYITIATGTTDITADMISAAPSTNLNHVGDGVLTLDAAGTGAGSDVVFSANQSNNTTVTPVWGTSNIGSSSITYAKMAANSIATAEIQNKAVTTAKLADGAVTSSKIDFTTIDSGKGLRLIGEAVLSSDGTSLSVSMNGQNPKRIVIVGAVETTAETWVDIRAYKSGSVINSTRSVRGAWKGSNVEVTKQTGSPFFAFEVSSNDSVTFRVESIRAGSATWRAWTGYGGGEDCAVVEGSHYNTATVADEFRMVSGANMIIGTTLQVWGN